MNSSKPIKRRKFVGEETYITQVLHSYTSSARDVRESFKAKALVEEKRRLDLVRAKRGRPRKSKPDFGKLDGIESPHISFDPASPMRERMLEVLGRPERDSTRKKLMSRLGTEFARIYARYRRDVERSFGRSATYDVLDKEKPYAAEAGMWCIIKGVSPRQVLEYWHVNIKTFANKGLQFPPLSLLKSPGIIDQVACYAMDPKAPSPTKREAGEPKHSFSDPDELHRRFRPAAKSAGFDVDGYSDRYLLGIQKMALSVARGERIFLSAELRPLVMWAAENVYADAV